MSVPYFTFGQIQDIKKDFYCRYKQGISFQRAVALLREQGLAHERKPDIPDFLSIDPDDTDALRRWAEAVPISVEEIERGGSGVRDGVVQLPTINLVQISLESCYTGPELICVDHFTMVYVLEGIGVLETPGISRELTAGQICLIPPQTPYRVFTRREDLVVNILSARERFRQDFSQLLYRNNVLSEFFRRVLFDGESECLFFFLEPNREARSLVCHMFHEFVQRDDYSVTLFSNYLQIFYATMMRSRDCPEFPNDKRKNRYQTILNVLRYIHENFRDVTMGSLSRQFHYEADYLGKLIKDFTGQNYSEIVSKLRLDYGRELLETTQFSIRVVAEQSGYHNPEHFSYAFRKAFDISPSQYRKRI